MNTESARPQGLPIPNARTIANLAIGGLAGLLLWEIFARVLTKAVGKKMGADKGNSKYLYGLFPYGPAKQACRYAGLPKPTGCV